MLQKMQSPRSLLRTTKSESLGAGVETTHVQEAFQVGLLHTRGGITAALALILGSLTCSRHIFVHPTRTDQLSAF